jgi:hypothetical protein
VVPGDGTEVRGRIYMNRGRVGEERGGKETDRCPLTVPIFHDDVTFILQPQIPQVTILYIDNVPVKGPVTMLI